MTTDQDVIIEAAADENPQYTMSPELLEQSGLSVNVVLMSRLCEAAKAKLSGDPQKMTYKQIRKLFVDNCADQDGYLSPNHPVVETVVRVLLITKSGTLTLNDIYQVVSDLWLSSDWSRYINVSTMRRILDHATPYGITRA